MGVFYSLKNMGFVGYRLLKSDLQVITKAYGQFRCFRVSEKEAGDRVLSLYFCVEKRDNTDVGGIGPGLRKENRMIERTKRFTDAEFKKLDRNVDGDIINLSEDFIWLTDSQKKRLTGDDYSRVDDYEEEMRCMIHDFCKFELGD